MKTLLLLGTLFIASAFAGGGGGLLPGNGWCGTQQQPIGTVCQSTGAVVDVASRKLPPRDPVIDAGLVVFSHIVVVVEDPKKITK